MSYLETRLRSLLVAVLTLALLFGPCLSISGFFGPGSAHAHGGVSDTGAEFDPHAHHGGGGTGHTPDKNDSQGSCDELCDGWAIQKTKRDIALTSCLPSDPNHDASGFPALVVSADFPVPVRKSRSTGRHGYEGVPRTTLPIYVLTSRYRL